MSRLIHRYFLLALGLLILPLLPLLGFFPVALSLLALGVLVLAFIPKNKGIHLETWADLGFALIGIWLILWELGSFLSSGVMYRSHSFLVYLLPVLAWFALKPLKHKLFRWQSLGFAAFGFLLFLSGWVFVHAAQYSYANLTVALSYGGGIGNISQIAIYTCFTLVLITALMPKDQLWVYMSFPLALGIGYCLDSKLVYLVSALLLLSVLLQKQDLKIKRWTAGVLAGGFILFVLLSGSDFLAGRLDILKNSLQNLDTGVLAGYGAGNFKLFINTVFVEGGAINAAGDFGPIAFNDFLQLFIELGLAGLIAWSCISFSALGGNRPFLSLSVLLVMAIMFPMQYVESGVMCVLCLMALEHRPFNRTRLRLPYILPLKVLGTAALIFSLYATLIHLQWWNVTQDTDNQSKKDNLASYEDLLPALIQDEVFLLQYAEVLLKNKEVNHAEKQLQKAKLLNPSYPVMLRLGDLYYQQADWVRARFYYHRAALLRPENLYPTYRQAFTYWEQGQKQKARSMGEQAIREFGDSGNPRVRTMLSDLQNLVSAG